MRRQLLPFERTAAVLTLLLVAGFYVFAFYVVPHLQQVFAEARLPIPTSTQFVLDTYRYWLIFPLLGIGGVALVLVLQDRRGWYLLACSALSAAVLLPVTVWTMYAPVMN